MTNINNNGRQYNEDPRRAGEVRTKAKNPIWVLVTGERDQFLSDWASPAFREILGIKDPEEIDRSL